MLVGWFLLSIIIGGLVGLAEIERIDQYVVELAKINSARLKDAYHLYFHDPTPDNKIALDNLSSGSVHDSNFVLVEIYNSQKEKVLKKTLERIEPIINELEKKQHTFLMSEKTDYMRIYHDKRLYLKIVTPILDFEDHHVIGYFEGIYQVSSEKMHEIALWLVWSIVQVILAILLTTIILYPVIIGLNKDLIQRSLDLSDANLGMLKVLGGAVAKRDSDTNAHNYRVTIYAIRLAEEIGMKAHEIRALVKGAFLHDVGKIGISDTILLKPAGLNDDEFKIMKLHVQHGVDIIMHYAWLEDAVDVVRYHHEKYDGNGYQEKLRGANIPERARIFAIADVFDALTSKRPYKEPFSYEKSISIIEKGAGSHFDSAFVTAFLKISRPLYEQLSGNEKEDVLNDLLNQLIRYYFKR